MLTVAVLCGGRGSRIASVAGDLPKALIPVAGTPFIAHQLRWLRDCGVRDVVLLTGYRAGQIAAFVGDGSTFDISIRLLEDGPEPLGTGGALQRALPLLGDRFLTVYGDSLPQADPTKIGAALDADEGVMSVFRNDDRLMPSNVRLDGAYVAAYDKQAALGTMTHIDYGINAFRASAFTRSVQDRVFDLSDVHRGMIERRSLRAFAVSERWYEIGSPEGLRETEAFVRSQSGLGGPF